MSISIAVPFSASTPSTSALRAPNIRKNGRFPPTHSIYLRSSYSKRTGKQWHAQKSAFRPTAGQTPYAKRAEAQKAQAVVKAKEREMRGDKEAERQVCGHMLAARQR